MVKGGGSDTENAVCGKVHTKHFMAMFCYLHSQASSTFCEKLKVALMAISKIPHCQNVTTQLFQSDLGFDHCPKKSGTIETIGLKVRPSSEKVSHHCEESY